MDCTLFLQLTTELFQIAISSVHKICPPGMQMYTCKVANCPFTTGSPQMLTRHTVTHSKSKDSFKTKSRTFFLTKLRNLALSRIYYALGSGVK